MLDFSIPLLTPPMITIDVISRNTTISASGEIVSEIKPVKYPSAAALTPSPVRKVIKYFITQPPIVQ